MSSDDSWAGIRRNARLLAALWLARRGASARVQFRVAGPANTPRPDPTHGRIDRDIQAAVAEWGGPDLPLAKRVAVENTLQERRDAGDRGAGA